MTFIIKNIALNSMILPAEYDGSNRLFIKRDDLLPFSFGGNKLRIAMEFFADMRLRGATCMVGYGNVRSNLSRVLACMSASEGIRCSIISPEKDGDVKKTFNSEIVKKAGAEIVSCDKGSVYACVSGELDRLIAEGEVPYYIYGDAHGHGNEITPVAAYDKAYNEIARWERQSNVKFDYIFTACGTGMTQAGLIAGKTRLASKAEIIGISIARTAETEIEKIQHMLCLYGAAKNIGLDTAKVNVNDKYLCGGYGKYSNEIIEIIEYALRNDGIPLDPTYTGKAFYGMKQYLSDNGIVGKNILFLHTGGVPLFFDAIGEICVK